MIAVRCEAEVPVTYFSMGGWFYGLTRGHELKNVFLRIEQFGQAQDPVACLRLARQFVNGKIRNHRTMLMRNHLEPPPATLLKLKQMADAALRAEAMDELLGIEGNGASAYFEQFSGMIKAEDDLPAGAEGATTKSAQQRRFNFNFTHRNRRLRTLVLPAIHFVRRAAHSERPRRDEHQVRGRCKHRRPIEPPARGRGGLVGP